MPDSPLCPNCSRPMSLSRTLPPVGDNSEEINVFRCQVCNVSFITEDHLPIAGAVVQ